MKLENYTPAKNNVLVEQVTVTSSGNILLKEDTGTGYYKVLKVGPAIDNTEVNSFVIIDTAKAMAFMQEIQFVDKIRYQVPEQVIQGYYTPDKEELEAPTPIFEGDEELADEFKALNSEGGDNDLGTEFGLREE